MKSGMLLLIFLLSPLIQAAEPSPSASLSASPIPVDGEALRKWQSNRFGIFIHWGPVSQTGQEISWSRGKQIPVETYDALYKTFDPKGFNADEWARIIQDSGARYAVLTCKHHDGFCLWDSAKTDYTIRNTPFQRDVVKELSAALRNKGIGFGAYYSVPDNHDPDYPYALTGRRGHSKRDHYDIDTYHRFLLAQSGELIRNYGPLLTIWYDTDGTVNEVYGKERGQEVINMVRTLQPDILINERTGARGDYSTPEQKVGGYDTNRPWESCMTVSAHNHWAWGGEKDGVKSPDAVIALLAQCAGGDGNMLLNVGPRPDGIIDPAQAAVLRSVGDWLKVHGESIYGTRGGPYKPTPDYASTRRGNTLYLHLLRWQGGSVILPPLPSGVQIRSATLPDGSRADISSDASRLTISVPPEKRSAGDTVIKLLLNQDASGLTPIAPFPTASFSPSPVS
jgi:alpha-L-fucosidase